MSRSSRPSLRLGIIRIISIIKSLFQLRITQDLIRLINRDHLLLIRRFLRLRGRLVRVVHLRQFEISALDFLGAGVTGYVEDFVVVFLLGALEGDLGFLRGFGEAGVGGELGMGVFERLEGAEGGFVVFGGVLG